MPGHIPGAFQFTPAQSLGLNQMLGNLPTDKPIVVYCWTGQQSSQLTAYLIMLGYEAYSLSYGANNLYYDSLTNLGVKWEATDQRDFPLVSVDGPRRTLGSHRRELIERQGGSTDPPCVIGPGSSPSAQDTAPSSLFSR